MKKQIDIRHHLDDYECMWNGIEDLYIRATGETLPPSCFFSLSSFGTFCYLKTEKAALKRMVALGDGRTKSMYEFLAPIAGFSYRHFECKSFDAALAKAKAEIDQDHPCVLGALDMCRLPYYPKLFGGPSIPFHYGLMTGYDDEATEITLLDCGRAQPQTLRYGDLHLAWDCAYPGLSKPNTVCAVRMEHPKDKLTVAREAIALRASQFLNPPAGFVGRKGFDKFIRELPKWETELTRADRDAIFANMVRFWGTVPTVPNALLGVERKDDMRFCGGFDKMARVLSDLGAEYGDAAFTNAAQAFARGGETIEGIKEIIVDALTGKRDDMRELPARFAEVLAAMTEGYEILT